MYPSKAARELSAAWAAMPITPPGVDVEPPTPPGAGSAGEDLADRSAS
jgi:hypothetical protein